MVPGVNWVSWATTEADMDLKPPEKLKLTGNVNENWRAFKQQFNHLYVTAMGLETKPDSRKKPTRFSLRRISVKRSIWKGESCICRGPEDLDDMVACDNENCAIQWFHLSCVGLSQAPSENGDHWHALYNWQTETVELKIFTCVLLKTQTHLGCPGGKQINITLSFLGELSLKILHLLYLNYSSTELLSSTIGFYLI